MRMDLLESTGAIIKSKIYNFINYGTVKKYYKAKEKICYESFSNIKNNALAYLDAMREGPIEYKFSNSSPSPTIYSTTYGYLLLGLFGEIDENRSNEIKRYFDSFQIDNGLFYDSRIVSKMYDTGEGWGAKHLLPHILIIYERLGLVPNKRFAFLDCYKDEDYLHCWLAGLDFKKPWYTSNIIMNTLCSLQYCRDRMNEDYSKVISDIESFLMENIRSNIPLWFYGKLNNRRNLYQAIRGAYHIYPELIYDNISIDNISELFKKICSVQNKIGGFDNSFLSTACDDIDCIDPIIRLSKNQRIEREHIDDCLRLAFDNILFNRNEDGGFCFSRSKNGFMYGDCTLLKSNENESNMFGTWFRILSLLEIFDYFKIEPFRGVGIPGYELYI